MMFEKEEKIKILLISLCSVIMVFVGVVCSFSAFKLKDDSKVLPDSLKKNTNVLAVLLSEDKKSADLIFVFSQNPKTNKIIFTGIPCGEKCMYEGAETSFGELYSEFGADELCAAAQKKSGLRIEKYICFDKTFFAEIVNVTGNVFCNFENSFSVEGESDSLYIQKGRNELNPYEFAEVFSYLAGSGRFKPDISGMNKALAEKVTSSSLAVWQKDELINAIKKRKTNLASYEAEEVVNVLLSMKNAEVLLR